MPSYAGWVAVVGEATTSVGAAIARELAIAGARVVALSRELEAAERLATEIGGVAFGADITAEDDLKAALAHVEQRVGPIDLFCSYAPDEEVIPGADRHQLAAELVVPDMVRRRRGRFVVVGARPSESTGWAGALLSRLRARRKGDGFTMVFVAAPTDMRPEMVARRVMRALQAVNHERQ